MSELLKYWPILLVIFAAGGMQWQVLAQSSDVETLEQQTQKIAEATQQLQQLHIAEDAKKQGAEELRRKLCRAGKLEESECDD